MDNYKTLIFEGLDRCLKDTLIFKLRKFIDPTQTIHFAKPPKVRHVKEYQALSFINMFKLIDFHNNAIDNSTIILNRSHIGEAVYSDIYRDYNGNYVFSLEEEFLTTPDDVFLIVLYDSNIDAYIKRDDGDSFNNADKDKILDEIQRFKDAFSNTIIPNKMMIDLADYYIDEERIDDEKIIKNITEEIL